jgi:hypothetical protein
MKDIELHVAFGALAAPEQAAEFFRKDSATAEEVPGTPEPTPVAPD